MRDVAVEAVVELLVALAATVGAVAFTLAGAFLEQAGLQALLSGAMAQGAWELWMGTTALFVGIYLLGYQTAWPAITGLR